MAVWRLFFYMAGAGGEVPRGGRNRLAAAIHFYPHRSARAAIERRRTSRGPFRAALDEKEKQTSRCLSKLDDVAGATIGAAAAMPWYHRHVWHHRAARRRLKEVRHRRVDSKKRSRWKATFDDAISCSLSFAAAHRHGVHVRKSSRLAHACFSMLPSWYSTALFGARASLAEGVARNITP